MKWYAIVIGSGLGGLTAAATLARAKKNVLLLEQHNIPGGCATTYKRNGMRFEAGLHELDWGKPNRDMKHIIFKNLGLTGRIPLVTIPESWDIKTEKSTFRVPHGYKNVIAVLEKEFPEEKKGIRAYFRIIERMVFANRKLPYDMPILEYYFYPLTTLPVTIAHYLSHKSIGAVLDKLIKSDRLKRILNCNIGYFHDDPHQFAWQFHASAQGSFYNSACFVKGGSQTLSDMLVDIIRENGGEVRLLCDVTSIEVEGKKARRVIWTDKKSKETCSAESEKIIVNCSPHILYKKLLPPKYEDTRLQKLKPSMSLYTVSLSFKKKMQSLFPNNAYSTFITEDVRLNAPFSCMGEETRNAPIEKRDFVFVDYSAINSGLTEDNDPRSFGVLTGISYMSEWEQLDEESYKTKKDQLAAALFARMEMHYSGFTENIEYFEVSTPKTIERFIRTQAGTAYGYKQDSYYGGRVSRRSRTVKNIFFAGAWSFPGGGFTGAIISGYMTARHVMCNMWLYIAFWTLVCSVLGTLAGIIIGSVSVWLPFLLSLLK